MQTKTTWTSSPNHPRSTSYSTYDSMILPIQSPIISPFLSSILPLITSYNTHHPPPSPSFHLPRQLLRHFLELWLLTAQLPQRLALPQPLHGEAAHGHVAVLRQELGQLPWGQLHLISRFQPGTPSCPCCFFMGLQMKSTGHDKHRQTHFLWSLFWWFQYCVIYGVASLRYPYLDRQT